MFTLFNLLNSNQVTETERDMIFSYINKYKESSYGNWLNNLNLSNIKFYWCNDMTDQNNILGAWNPLFYNDIYVKSIDKSKLNGNKFNDQLVYDFHFGLIIPTILHELYHKYQCKKYTLPIYALLAIPLWREYTIEKSAYKISDNASDWIMILDEEKFKEEFNKLHLDFYGLNYDIDNQQFITNYDKEYCNSQYQKYLNLRKNKQISLYVNLTCPPNFYSDTVKISL